MKIYEDKKRQRLNKVRMKNVKEEWDSKFTSTRHTNLSDVDSTMRDLMKSKKS